MELNTEAVFKFYGLSLAHNKPPVVIEQSRDTLPALFNHLGYDKGAEIGVEFGTFSETIADGLPGVQLYAIDPYDAYPGYREHLSQSKMDAMYKQATERLAGKAQILRQFSIAAVMDFNPGDLDFVYIDGNHSFLHITEDIHYWSSIVRHGGIVAGHDYKRHKGEYINHVKDVVQAWTYSHAINPWFVLTGDKSASWFWVKA